VCFATHFTSDFLKLLLLLLLLFRYALLGCVTSALAKAAASPATQQLQTAAKAARSAVLEVGFIVCLL
jgi:hypothetical protein